MSVRPLFRVALALAALAVIGALVWQGVVARGAPDPTAPHTSPTVAILDIGVLVFREGLECILVLSRLPALEQD
jgi:high-affinity iron transporter